MLRPSATPGQAGLALFLPPLVVWIFYLERFRSPAYLILGVLLLAAAWWARGMGDKSLPRFLPHALLLAGGALLVFLGWYQHWNFRSPGDVDTACSVNSFANLLEGRLYNSVYGANTFATHSDYLAVLFLPFYALMGTHGLFLAQGLGWMAFAWLLLKDQPARLSALLLAIAILLTPQLASKPLFGFHTDILGAPFLALAFLAYRRIRLGLFLMAAAASVWSKEVYALAVGGIMLVALAERRPWRWLWAPGLVCGALILLYWKGIMPALNPSTGGEHRLSAFMPDSPGQWLALWFRGESLAYALQTYLPFLPLFLAAGKRYALLLLPLVLFYMGFPDSSYRDIWRHYGLAVGATAWGAWILADREKAARAALPMALAALLSYPGWRELQRVDWRPNPLRAEIRQVAALIPDTASLTVHGPFVAHFAGRQRVENWVYRTLPPEHFQYVLLDSAYRPEWWEGRSTLDSSIREFRGDGNWETAHGSGGLYLFRRKAESARSGGN